MKGIDCHLCNHRLREYQFINGKHCFTCDTKWCPVDDYIVEVRKSPKKQEDGTWLMTYEGI